MFWKARNGSSAPSIVIGCFVATGGLLFGWDTGNINGILAMDSFVNQYATHTNDQGKPYITSGEQSLMVSILSAGTVFGALTANYAADSVGRRWSLSLSSIIFTVGVVLQVISDALPLFVIGRLVTGFGVGQISVLVPLYQAESSPKWIRGTIIGCYQLSITIGLLLTTIVSNATEKMPNTGAYRIPIALQSVLSIILGIGMIFLPETPRYLIKNGRHQEAIKSLCKLRALPPDHRLLQDELQEIEVFAQAEAEVGKASWIDCFRGSGGNMGKRLMTGCGLQALQQLTGINFIFYYGTNFFKHSGVEKPFIIALICNVVNVIATIPGLYLVEKAGRAPLLFVGALGMGVTQLVIAVVGCTTNTTISNKVLVAVVCVYIAFFACTWGLGGWIVTGEIFPLRVRAKSMSLTAGTNWVVNWALGYSTPYLVDNTDGSAGLGVKIFFLWSFFCFLSVYFVHKDEYGVPLVAVLLYLKFAVIFVIPQIGSHRGDRSGSFVRTYRRSARIILQIQCDTRDVVTGRQRTVYYLDAQASFPMQPFLHATLAISLFIRETKGISLEQIDSLYQTGKAAKIRNRLSTITSNSSSIRKRDSRHLDYAATYNPNNPYPYFPTLERLDSLATTDSTNNLQHHYSPPPRAL